MEKKIETQYLTARDRVDRVEGIGPDHQHVGVDAEQHLDELPHVSRLGCQPGVDEGELPGLLGSFHVELYFLYLLYYKYIYIIFIFYRSN